MKESKTESETCATCTNPASPPIYVRREVEGRYQPVVLCRACWDAEAEALKGDG